MDKKVLIIGYGKMGSLYGRILQRKGIEFNFIDPNHRIDSSFRLKNEHLISSFTHAIITSPIGHHYDSYQKVTRKIPDDNIFIIKPVAAYSLEAPLLEKGIFYGMSERYNPVFHRFKSFCNERNDILGMEFRRYINSSVYRVFLELAIHDFDILDQVYSLDGCDLIHGNNIDSSHYIVLVKKNDILFQFNGGCSGFNERQIITFCKDETFKFDFLNYRIYYYDKKGNCREEIVPVEQNIFESQLDDFLGSRGCNARTAHQFLLTVSGE